MELQTTIWDITPKTPVMQGGYGTRTKPFESVHDPIMASIFIITIQTESYIWIGADLSNGTGVLIDQILVELETLHVSLDKAHLIFGGSHTHSGPNIYVDREPEVADQDYFYYVAKAIAEGIVATFQKKKVEVTTKFSKIYIDGLYSNRDDANKRCDKYVHVLGFFSEEKCVAMFVELAHHCTILGPDNYQLSADLFGAIRTKLMDVYHVPVLMAQGNAADMGNRQYRVNNGFEALTYQAQHLCEQIQEKLTWEIIDMEGYEYHSYVYEATYELCPEEYLEKLQQAQEKYDTTTDADEKKLLFSAIRGYKRKIDLGSGIRHLSMPVEIIQMKELQLIIVPCELGSILGMEIKEISNAKDCIIWGYANGAHLGYLVEGDAYDEDSFESRISNYPKGVGDRYASFIKEKLIALQATKKK